jgi:hypothetical protein
MYKTKLTPSYVDMIYSKGVVRKGFLMIFISATHISIFIYRKGRSSYEWMGRKRGKSGKLLLKFHDDKRMISINSSNKLIFHRPKDYETIKKKTIIYKHMKANENTIEFQSQ